MKKNVGVYIATANRPELFDRALASLSIQTIIPDQVSVSINGNPDFFTDYQGILNKYKNIFSDLTFDFHEKQLNPGFAKNSAMQRLDTELCTGLDDDDFFTPNRIENFITCYNKISGKGFHVLYSNQIVLKPSGASIIQRPSQIERGMLCKRNYVGNQSFGKTQLFKNCAYSDLQVIDDYDFAIRLYEASDGMMNTGKFDYVWDQSNTINRVSTRPPQIFSSIYDDLSRTYVESYGGEYHRFKYGKFEYSGVRPSLSDLKSISFYMYGLPKYLAKEIKKKLRD